MESATGSALKDEPGDGLATGGVMLPTALAELGLIDEYQFVVHPHVAGGGPTLLAGLTRPLELELVDRLHGDARCPGVPLRPPHLIGAMAQAWPHRHARPRAAYPRA